MKPENRIDLQNLLVLKSKLVIDNIHNDFSTYVKNMIQYIFFTKTGDTSEYEYTLLTQSTRSVLQILQAWDEMERLNTNFIDRFKHTFYTTLKKKLEPYTLIELPQREKFLNLLSVYILKETISRDNHLKLTPSFAKEDDNITMLYLNMMANHLLKPQDYLSYFIKVGYVLEQYSNVVVASGKNEILNFIDHIGLDNHTSAVEISKKLLTTFKIDSNTHNTKPIFFGNLSISKNNLKSIKNKNNLSLLMSRVYNLNGNYYNILSIFNLIGLLADISNHEDIENILKLNNVIRDFRLYDNSTTSSKSNEEQEVDDDENVSFNISEELSNSLIAWAKTSKDIKQTLSMADLAKIWIRFVTNINEIENRSNNRIKNYSVILDLYWAAFLNALYIWCEDKKGTTGIDFKNPSESSNFFYEKLKKDERYEEQSGLFVLKESEKENGYTLFDYLYACPIFNLTAKYFENLSNITSKINFGLLSKEQQIEAIKNIQNWKTKAEGTIITDLSKQYKNIVKRNMSALILEINPKSPKKATSIEDNKVIDS
ncbi:MAG: hypothetical protein PHX13_06545 [Thiovulaceae bacterium]|nr:hypothetical protein [Sulfurimonadaceae bacterium]